MTSKKDLSERDIITKFIIPAIGKVGWNIEKQVAERKKQAEGLMQAVLREAFGEEGE